MYSLEVLEEPREFVSAYLRELRPGVYELTGTGTIQYLSIRPSPPPVQGDPRSLRLASEFGLGPGYVIALADRLAIRYRYDSDLPLHINDELIAIGNTRNKIVSNVHIPLK